MSGPIHPKWLNPQPRDVDVARLAAIPSYQRQMLHELATGDDISTVAARREVSPSAVKRHLDQIYAGLGLRCERKLARACYLLGRWDEQQRGGR